MSERKVIAFEYDSASTGSDAAVSFGVIPGIWTPGEAVAPEAFGMSVQQMRDAIEEHNLPLVEVKVGASKVVSELDKGLNHLPTEARRLGDPGKPSDRVVETNRGPLPASGGSGNHPELLPMTAAMQARNTVLATGGTLEDAAAAAREAGGEWGDGIAEVTEAAAADAGEAAGHDEAPELTDAGDDDTEAGEQ